MSPLPGRNGFDNLHSWSPIRRTANRVGLATGRITINGVSPAVPVIVQLLDYDRNSQPDGLSQVVRPQVVVVGEGTRGLAKEALGHH